MRDIRARIVQRHGIELSTQQIQELAARRLEAILDPRVISPTLMEQLRKGAGAAPEVPASTPEPAYAFEDSTLYESHRGLLRFIRRLLNPILKLFFNPTPLIHALHTQARLNTEAAAREAQRERLQAEWNALHYELLQRLVTEVSRVSIEMQSLTLRVESLATRVDFNDRRVRTLEGVVPQGRPQPPRPPEPVSAAAAAPGATDTAPAEAAGTDGTASEGARRRRRRRRGRRGGAVPTEGTPGGGTVSGDDLSGADAEEAEEDATSESGASAAADPEVQGSSTPPAEDRPLAAPPAVPEVAAAPDGHAPAVEQPMPPRDEPASQATLEQPDPGPPER